MVRTIAGPSLAGKQCPVCLNPIVTGAALEVCDACGLPHHEQCWDYNGRCSTFGCQGVASAQTHTHVDHPSTYSLGSSTTNVRYAQFGTRFWASIIDLAILWVVTRLIAYIVTSGRADLGSDLARISGALIGLAYYVGMNATYGATVGKMILGVRITMADGRPLSLGTALGRHLLEWLFATITFALAYLSVAMNPRRQGWHDRIMDTVVVHTR